MSRLLSISPQFLVSDLQASIAYYTTRLGFEQSISYQDFYASVRRDSAEIHLKRAAPLKPERLYRRTNDHIDAYVTVTDLDEYYEFCKTRGAYVFQELASHPWDVTDFCIEDPDGYIVCFAQADG